MTFCKIDDSGIYIDLEKVQSFTVGYVVQVNMDNGDKFTVGDLYVAKFLDYFSRKQLK